MNGWIVLWSYLGVGFVGALLMYLVLDWMIRHREDVEPGEYEVFESKLAGFPGGVPALLTIVLLFWPVMLGTLFVGWINDSRSK